MTRTKLRTYITTLAIIMAISLCFGILGFIPKANAVTATTKHYYGLTKTQMTIDGVDVPANTLVIRSTDFSSSEKSNFSYKGVNTASSMGWNNSTIKKAVTSIKILDTISPLSTKNWFNAFTAVEECDLVNLDISNVPSNEIGSMFYNNSALKKITVSASLASRLSETGLYSVHKTWYKEGDPTPLTAITAAGTYTTEQPVSTNSWRVSYNTNGGETMQAENVTKGESVTLPTPTKSGYVFLGWNDASGSAVTSPYTPTDNCTLYANWRELAKYTVTFDTNGGNNLAAQQVTESSSITLPTPTKNGNEFLGWYDALGSAVTSPYTPTGDCTLYAKWQEASYWTVKIDNQDGNNVSSSNINKGEEFTFPNSNPTLTDSEFLGWNTKQDGTGTYYQKNANFTPDADTIFYAIWQSSITFKLNGAEESDFNIESVFPKNAIHGAKVTLPKITVNKTEVAFTGYTVKDSNNKTITVANNSFTMPKGNVNVTANFTAEGLKVTFMDGTEVYTTKFVNENSLVERPNDPTNSGALRFGGWYTDTSKSSKCNKFDFSFDKITKDTTLYALWINPVDTQSFMAYIDKLITDTENNNYSVPAWCAENIKYQWNYIDGVILNGIVNLYYTTNDEKYKDFFLNYVDIYVNDDGKFVNIDQNKVVQLKELDFICESKILFDAYELSHKEKYIKAIENTYKNLTSMGTVDGTNGNYEHKSSCSQQVWLDGMYMYAPFNARYLAATKQSDELFTKLKKQYEFIKNSMKAPNGLYYHAYTSKPEDYIWADKDNNCSHNFWSRSVGWLTMSLVDVIEYFPEGSSDRQFLMGMFNDLIDALIKFKDEDTDMFYQILDGDSSLTATKNGETRRNYLEASGSSMVAYALQKGARLGYLTNGTYDYRKEGRETFEGIYNHSLDTNKNILYDICIQAGLDNKTKDGSVFYYLGEKVNDKNEAKGTGPFILAFIEYTYSEPTTPITPDIRKKTATFSVDDNTSKIAPIEFYTGQIITEPQTPSVSGKNFKHWSLYPNGIAFDFKTTPIGDDTTFYAVWESDEVSLYNYKCNKDDILPLAKDLSINTQLTSEGYSLIGWTTDYLAIYESGTAAPVSGTYTAVYAKAKFLGGSIRQEAPTGVRFGFCLYFYGITDEATIAKLATKISAEFNVVVNGYDNKVKAKSYKYDEASGGMIMNVVIINSIDATKSSNDLAICKIRLKTSITVKLQGSSTIIEATGVRSIQEIAKSALKAKQIELSMAKKYGYEETTNS